MGNDLRMPETTGPRNAGVNFINWYMSKLHKVGQRDAEVSLAFHRVGNLLAPPPSVMHPKVLMRVLRGSLWPPKLTAEREVGATVASPDDLKFLHHQ